MGQGDEGVGEWGQKSGGGKFWASVQAVQEEQARDPSLPRRGRSKGSLGQGVGVGGFQEIPPPLMESILEVRGLHPMTPGSVIVASAGSGPQLPHTNIATHPQVQPPCGRGISGCHMSSFLCLSEEYQVRVQAGTALTEAAPPLNSWFLLLTCRARAAPVLTKWCGWGRGQPGGWGCGKGMLPMALFADASGVPSLAPHTCPYHLTFLLCSAPANLLAKLEVAEHSVLFFAGLVH